MIVSWWDEHKLDDVNTLATVICAEFLSIYTRWNEFLNSTETDKRKRSKNVWIAIEWPYAWDGEPVAESLQYHHIPPLITLYYQHIFDRHSAFTKHILFMGFRLNLKWCGLSIQSPLPTSSSSLPSSYSCESTDSSFHVISYCWINVLALCEILLREVIFRVCMLYWVPEIRGG